MAFTKNKTETVQFIPQDMRQMFEMITRDAVDEGFFASDNWTGGRSLFDIKVSPTNFNAILSSTQTQPIAVSGKRAMAFNIGGYNVRFLESGKKAGAADASTTRSQELGSAWIFRRALNDNMRYASWKDIAKDPKFKELERLFPTIDEEWLQAYYAQQERMLKEFSGSRWTEFNREGGFMKYISDLIRSKFGVSQKDNWNPADIWMIRDEPGVRKIIEDTVAGGKSQTIQELNAVMRALFKERRVVGISLKKVSGKMAEYQEYNLDDVTLDSKHNYRLNVDSIKLYLGLQGTKFSTQDTVIVVKGEQVEYKFQIKGNDSQVFSNLKFEPTQKGYGAARIGKAPVDMVALLIKDNHLKFENENKKYPKTAQEFVARQAEYEKMFKFIRTKNVNTGTATDVSTFITNITTVFGTEPHVANSKLMQLTFLNQILSLSKDKLDELMTDMVFIAAKQGSRFGPFGKLY